MEFQACRPTSEEFDGESIMILDIIKRLVIGRDNGPLLQRADKETTRAVKQADALTRGLRRINRISDDPLTDIARRLRERQSRG